MWTSFNEVSTTDLIQPALQTEQDTVIDCISSSLQLDLPQRQIGSVKPILISGQWYVPVDEILANPQEVFRQCQTLNLTLTPVRPKYQDLQAQQQISKQCSSKPNGQITQKQSPIRQKVVKQVQQTKSVQDSRFKWNREESIVFARIITAAGVRMAKPRDIEKYFPVSYNLTLGMIGSHIQKYKLKLIKQYGLRSVDDLQNINFQQDLSDPVLEGIALRWETRGFLGFSEQEIFDFVRTCNV